MDHYLCLSLLLPLTLLVVLPLLPHLVVMVSLVMPHYWLRMRTSRRRSTSSLTRWLRPMCLGSQRASLYKEGLGYTPKKGKVAFAPHKTSFVTNNDRFCTSCKQVGHKEHECKNKSKNANVSSIKLDSFYVPTKGTNDVKAKFIGKPWIGSKKKVIWIPKSLVTNLQGPK